MRKSESCLPALLAFLVGFSANLSAQDAMPTAVTPSNNSGDLPFSASLGSSIEHIDLGSGNLIVNIPFVDVPGRKMTFDFGLRYDARYWTQKFDHTNPYWAIEQRNWLTTNGVGWTPTQGYMTYTLGKAYCIRGSGVDHNPSLYYDAGGQRGDGYIFTDANGGKHSFLVNLFYSGECLDSSPNAIFDSSNYAGVADDFSGWTVAIDSSGYPSTIAAPDGVSYGVGGSSAGWGNIYQGNYFVDMAGEVDASGNGQAQAAGGQDSVGRTPITQTSTANQLIYTIHDSDGNPRQFTVNLTNVNIATTLGYGSQELYQTRQAIGSIVLPNQQQYSFQYDSYADITEMTLPTGAVISYTWTDASSALGGAGREVSSRSIIHDGVTSRWDISYSLSLDGLHHIVTVTDPPDPQGTRRQEIYTYDSSQRLIQSQYYAASGGTLLRQYDLGYDTLRYSPIGGRAKNSLLASVKTTLENGLVSQKLYQYDLFAYANLNLRCGDYGGRWTNCATLSVSGNYMPPSYLPPPSLYPGSHGNVTTIQEYDWGVGSPGSLVRQTIRSYLHDANSAYFVLGLIAPGATGGQNYLNIANRVTSETVYDGTAVCSGTGTWTGDGTITPPAACTANKLAQRTVVYDNGDPTTYGYRGEATTVSQWLGGSSRNVASTNYVYDSHGNVHVITDPRSNSTTYNYGDATVGSSSCPGTSGANAYLTSVSNALSQTTQFTHYQCTGKLASESDPNDIAAGRVGKQYTYDLMGRVSLVSSADGGQTKTIYDDAAKTVDVQTLIAAGKTHEALTLLDSLGRTVQTQVLSDPQGTAYVDTTYDALGRVRTVSNPYRTSGEVTGGVTTSEYDALDRKTMETEPDSNTLQWSYSGATTTSTDEMSNSWQRTTDALGRLTNVTEPGALQTNYGYDPLGNLLSVNQPGVTGEKLRSRSFTYDSLSRLVQSYNPETGWICYGTTPGNVAPDGKNCTAGYDGNGNLQHKTDIRAIRTDYSYDKLNRLLMKSYTTAPVGTLWSCYAYDTATNGIGRLAAEWTQAGSCPAPAAVPTTGFQSMRQFLAYDSMGRVWNEQQCVLGHCSSGPTPPCAASGITAPFYQTFCYDLAGNLTWSTNGVSNVPSVGSIAFTPQYDGAGRLSMLQSSWADTLHPSILFTVDSTSGYAPAGGLQKFSLGSHVSVNKTYDNRLRTTGETATQQ